MRVVDVTIGAVVSLSDSCEYAILSYVWGPTNSMRLTTLNIQAMREPGSLHLLKVPQTILQAMTVTEDLGLQYLWVDSVCIVQDSGEDTSRDQIHKMDRIYCNAAIAIVDGYSSHADGGLWLSGSR